MCMGGYGNLLFLLTDGSQLSGSILNAKLKLLGLLESIQSSITTATSPDSITSVSSEVLDSTRAATYLGGTIINILKFSEQDGGTHAGSQNADECPDSLLLARVILILGENLNLVLKASTDGACCVFCCIVLTNFSIGLSSPISIVSHTKNASAHVRCLVSLTTY